jgi:hypothetical protein
MGYRLHRWCARLVPDVYGNGDRALQGQETFMRYGPTSAFLYMAALLLNPTKKV